MSELTKLTLILLAGLDLGLLVMCIIIRLGKPGRKTKERCQPRNNARKLPWAGQR